MNEHAVQNTIRNALAGKCILFRANVGSGWQGNGKPYKAQRTQQVIMQQGDVLLRQGRPFSTGLPPGFTDTFGLVQVTITADMVGQVIAVPIFGEIKDEDGKLSAIQDAFLRAMKNYGARAGVWRTVEDALATVLGEGKA